MGHISLCGYSFHFDVLQQEEVGTMIGMLIESMLWAVRLVLLGVFVYYLTFLILCLVKIAREEI